MNTSDFTEYNNCILCPRMCGTNRTEGKPGYCLCDARLLVSRAALHMWEEPCISGTQGSGAVFFSGCSMHCVYCQNHAIQDASIGKEISVERLSQIFLELQSQHAANINLVTPTQYIPHIVKALKTAKANGLIIPVVYNTSGYERVESLRLLDGLVDIYLPDFKYIRTDNASLLSKAPNYPEVAKDAIEEMIRQVRSLEFDEETGLMKHGVIVRHLILPEHTNEAKEIIRYLYETYSDSIYISIMNQYTPLTDQLPTGMEYAFLHRKITTREYNRVVDYAIGIGVKNAFIQEGATVSASFIPPFDYEGV